MRIHTAKWCIPQPWFIACVAFLQGHFIYSKFAIEELSRKPRWNLSEIDATLPEGREGMFKLILGNVQGALAAERPDLFDLLRYKVIVACKAPASHFNFIL